MAIGLLETPRTLLSAMRAVRHAQREQRSSVLVSRGEPAAVVVPFDNRLEAWALTRAPEFLQDIDEAEEQIAAGTMTPLEDVLRELEIDDEEPIEAAIDVSAGMERVVAKWLVEGASFLAPSDRWAPMHADFRSGREVVFQLKRSPDRAFQWPHRERSDRDERELTVIMHGRGERDTFVTVTLHAHGGEADRQETLGRVRHGLTQFKSQLESQAGAPDA